MDTYGLFDPQSLVVTSPEISWTPPPIPTCPREMWRVCCRSWTAGILEKRSLRPLGIFSAAESSSRIIASIFLHLADEPKTGWSVSCTAGSMEKEQRLIEPAPNRLELSWSRKIYFCEAKVKQIPCQKARNNDFPSKQPLTNGPKPHIQDPPLASLCNTSQRDTGQCHNSLRCRHDSF